jgi:GTP cyclohydrolase II
MSTLPSLVSCWLPTELGEFQLHGVTDPVTGREHAALTMGDIASGAPVLTRLHSECLTGDTLFSLKCDCGPQLRGAIEAIAKEGRGVLVYLRQEGRGIGLVNKIRAYALQQAGADTVDANRLLGLPDDSRDYQIAHDMLVALGVSSVRLMTNNPAKVEALRRFGTTVAERVELNVGGNPHNAGYLDTKARRMGHLISTPMNLHGLFNKEQS